MVLFQMKVQSSEPGSSILEMSPHLTPKGLFCPARLASSSAFGPKFIFNTTLFLMLVPPLDKASLPSLLLLFSCSVVSNSLQPHGLQHTKLPCPSSATAKSLQSCPILCNPIEGSPPGSPSLGFSRQEHWSGLPFPSPMQESKK